MEALSRTAAGLRPWAFGEKPAPRLLFFTDPVRTPDPEAIAERLPPGSAVVYRSFGAGQALDRAQGLREITTRRGLTLLIGADPELALRVGADGVHLPERLIATVATVRARRPDWLITAATHSVAAARAANSMGVDAIVISPVFASNSASAGQPLGLAGLQAIVAASNAPAYALGGVNARTAVHLLESHVIGFAAVEAFSPRT